MVVSQSFHGCGKILVFSLSFHGSEKKSGRFTVFSWFWNCEKTWINREKTRIFSTTVKRPWKDQNFSTTVKRPWKDREKTIFTKFQPLCHFAWKVPHANFATSGFIVRLSMALWNIQRSSNNEFRWADSCQKCNNVVELVKILMENITEYPMIMYPDDNDNVPRVNPIANFPR